MKSNKEIKDDSINHQNLIKKLRSVLQILKYITWVCLLSIYRIIRMTDYSLWAVSTAEDITPLQRTYLLGHTLCSGQHSSKCCTPTFYSSCHSQWQSWDLGQVLCGSLDKTPYVCKRALKKVLIYSLTKHFWGETNKQTNKPKDNKTKKPWKIKGHVK